MTENKKNYNKVNFSGEERRQYIRYKFKNLLKHKSIDSETWVDSYIDNICLNGLIFYTSENYLKNDIIRLKIDTNYSDALNIIFTARVAWSLKINETDKDSYAIGVQFVDIDTEQNEYLHYIIHTCVIELYKLSKESDYKQTYKILYIDDNVSLIKLFTCLSQEYNFIALVCSSIDEAVKIAELECPDIIITDIKLEEGDGFKLTSQLKINKKTQQIPVIGCSVTYPDLEKKFFLLGGNKFINDKPSTIDKLNKILEGVLPRIST